MRIYKAINLNVDNSLRIERNKSVFGERLNSIWFVEARENNFIERFLRVTDIYRHSDYFEYE